MGSVASYFGMFEEYLITFCIEKWKCIVVISILSGFAASLGYVGNKIYRLRIKSKVDFLNYGFTSLCSDVYLCHTRTVLLKYLKIILLDYWNDYWTFKHDEQCCKKLWHSSDQLEPPTWLFWWPNKLYLAKFLDNKKSFFSCINPSTTDFISHKE